MPTKHETKPCIMTGCDGTMTATEFFISPSGDAGVVGPKSSAVTRPGWQCDANREHIELKT